MRSFNRPNLENCNRGFMVKYKYQNWKFCDKFLIEVKKSKINGQLTGFK